MEDKMIRLDGKLHKRAKIKATQAGISIKEWLEKAVKKALKK